MIERIAYFKNIARQAAFAMRRPYKGTNEYKWYSVHETFVNNLSKDIDGLSSSPQRKLGLDMPQATQEIAPYTIPDNAGLLTKGELDEEIDIDDIDEAVPFYEDLIKNESQNIEYLLEGKGFPPLYVDVARNHYQKLRRQKLAKLRASLSSQIHDDTTPEKPFQFHIFSALDDLFDPDDMDVAGDPDSPTFQRSMPRFAPADTDAQRTHVESAQVPEDVMTSRISGIDPSKITEADSDEIENDFEMENGADVDVDDFPENGSSKEGEGEGEKKIILPDAEDSDVDEFNDSSNDLSASEATSSSDTDEDDSDFEPSSQRDESSPVNSSPPDHIYHRATLPPNTIRRKYGHLSSFEEIEALFLHKILNDAFHQAQEQAQRAMSDDPLLQEVVLLVFVGSYWAWAECKRNRRIKSKPGKLDSIKCGLLPHAGHLLSKRSFEEEAKVQAILKRLSEE